MTHPPIVGPLPGPLATPAVPAIPGRPRVLVVDDEDGTLRVSSSFLSAAGMDAVVAATVERALALLASETFDTILTAYRAPGTGATALLTAARERDADLPVVLVASCAASDLPVGVTQLAPAGVLLEPAAGDLLVRTVSRSVRFCRLARLGRGQTPPPPGTAPAIPCGPAVAPAFARALTSLYLAWQPIVRAADGSIWGHEAFVRTLEPSLANPAAFFGIASDLDRVVDLGRAVRRTAASEIGSFPDEALFVNVHPSELEDDDLLDAASPLSGAARSVVLEVSERTPLEAGGILLDRLRNLRRLGFRIAVDDFGSGAADVAMLARLEPDIVKLDLPLIRDLDADPAKQARVRVLTTALHDLGMSVAAEGIETAGERYSSVDLGVDFLQGFLFGRPKPASESATSWSPLQS